MRIGIDARPLQHETRFRGIGKSLEFMLLELKKYLRPTDHLTFYVDSDLPKPELLDHYPKAKIIVVPASKLGRKRYVRSVLPSFRPVNPSPKSIDVLLQYDASFGVPKSVPTVVVFHDLIPYLFKGQEKMRPVKGTRKFKDALARSLYWKKYLRVWKNYKKARKVIAISESSKSDLLKYVDGVKAANVKVIYHGVRPVEAGEPSTKIGRLAARPFLLYVGGIDIRKNITSVLETFYQIKPRHSDLRLVMVGKEFELKDRLEDLGWFTILNQQPEYAKDVIVTGYLPTADWAYLYKKASAFVLASRYEGFGLPALEAMASGCPVVAYDNSSIAEVVGDGALLVKDGEPLAPAVEKLLTNSQLRRNLVSKGKSRAAKFSWDKTAEQTLAVLRKAVNN